MAVRTVVLFPLYHRGDDQIAIKFHYDQELKELVKGLGAQWSQTHKCFYMAQQVVRHTEKPTAQTAHLVFADTRANDEKNKRAVFCQRSTELKN